MGQITLYYSNFDQILFLLFSNRYRYNFVLILFSFCSDFVFIFFFWKENTVLILFSFCFHLLFLTRYCYRHVLILFSICCFKPDIGLIMFLSYLHFVVLNQILSGDESYSKLPGFARFLLKESTTTGNATHHHLLQKDKVWFIRPDFIEHLTKRVLGLELGEIKATSGRVTTLASLKVAQCLYVHIMQLPNKLS